MKNLILTAFIAISGFASAQLGGIANGNFDLWSSDTSLIPTPWLWSAQFGEGLSERVGSAQHQTYAIKLTTDADSNAGILALGDFSQGLAGIPYNSPVDSLIFWAKYDFPGSSTGEVIVIQFSQGNFVPSSMTVTGTANGWTRMGLELLSPFQDSIAIIFATGPLLGSGETVPGATMTVDNVFLKGFVNGAALPNQSFELYDETVTPILTDYTTTNDFAGFNGLTPNLVTKTTDKKDGAFAARLQGADSQNGYLPGAISNAFDENLNETNGVPTFSQPDSLVGWYKYASVNGDEFFIEINFTKNGNVVASNSFSSSTSSNVYTRFSIPLIFTEAPDSMRLDIYSGDTSASVLLVDKFELVGGNLGLNEVAELKTKVYPNPVNDVLFVGGNQALTSIEIVNIQGALVKTVELKSILTQVNIADLSPGTYFVNAHSATGVHTTKIVKK